MYKIREASVDDFHMIAKINGDSNHLHLSGKEPRLQRDNFEQLLTNETTRLYVVEKSREIAAYILFHVNMKENALYIDQFSVDRFYENKGLDEHLYQKVERFALRNKMGKMIAESISNAFHDFFERKGWNYDPNEKVYLLQI